MSFSITTHKPIWKNAFIQREHVLQQDAGLLETKSTETLQENIGWMAARDSSTQDNDSTFPNLFVVCW